MSTHTKGKLIAVEVGVSDMGPNGVPVYELIAEGGYKRIAEHLHESDARRLALCWNTHDQLLEALEGLMELEKRGRIMPIGREWDAARAAIKAAKGEA